MVKIKDMLRKNRFIKSIYYLLWSMSPFFSFRPILMIKKAMCFLNQLRHFKRINNNENFKSIILSPCYFDKIDYTPVEPTYFFQDSWAAKHIFESKPTHHCDVGSSVKTMAIISQFVPITMIDIRPIELELPNLFFKKGSILNLPFEDNSIDSLSCLCVVEHIGLGRYGDPLDPFGSEKAIKELKRVLKPGGILLISIPVDSENRIYFNAHRAFTRDYILKLFDGFEVLDENIYMGIKCTITMIKARGLALGYIN